MKRIGKQFISLILVLGMIIVGTGTAFSEQEENPSLSEQDNHLKTTDLLVYLDEAPIHAYSLNDQTLILLNDLKDYGFNVGVVHGGSGGYVVTKIEKKNSTFQPVFDRDHPGEECGQVVPETRLKVFFNGEEIPAYTTGINKGYTVDDKEYVSVKDLSACTEDELKSIYKIGSIYDEVSKKLWLSTQIYPGTEEEKGYSYWTSVDTQDLQKEHLLLTENYGIHYWTEANETMPSVGDLYAFISYKDGASQIPLKNTIIWNGIASTKSMLIGSFGGIEYPSFQQDSETGNVLIFERPGRVFLLNPYTMEAILQDTAETETPAFNDVQGHWAEKAINRWKDAGFINGYPDGSFQPDEKVTRAEFSKMITMAFDLKQSVSVDGYNDLNQNEWYYGYILYAAKYLPVYPFPSDELSSWWITFYENNGGGFLPSAPTLRVHVAEALSRIMEDREGIEVQIPDMQTVTDTLSHIYDDPILQTGSSAAETREFTSNYERMIDAVWIATKLGIMNGYGNTFEPAGLLTRAEAVTVIDRVLLKNSISDESETSILNPRELRIEE